MNMNRDLYKVFSATLLAGTLLLSGCGDDDDTLLSESNITLRVLVSSLHYVKDANASLGGEAGSYSYYGLYDFYTEDTSGARVIEGGRYITNDTNESNESAPVMQCPNFSVDINDTLPTLKAPADVAGIPAYININPFTTLLVDGNYTKEELQARFPIAAGIQSDFNFDATMARYVYDSEEENLSIELCEALGELLP